MAVFLILDAAIFRSGLYLRAEKPVTPAGSMAAIIRFVSAGSSDPKRDILVLGNSRVEYGLSQKDVEQDFPAAPFHLVLGAFPASNEEFWYYVLNRIDPDRNRYAAIVIPLAGYRIGPVDPDPAGHYETAQMLAPIVPFSHVNEFLEGFDNPKLRWRAAILALFPSHAYASDLQDLLLHPNQRLGEVERRNAAGLKYLYGQDGELSTMDELKVDPATQRITAFPPRFNLLFRDEFNRQFTSLSPDLAAEWTRRNAEFRRNWLKKIQDAYTRSETKLIFMNIPHQPMPIPAQQPLPDAPDIRSLLPKTRNSVFLPADTFSKLENPHYFLDLAHMNGFGRKLFSRQFGQALVDLTATRASSP